MVVAGIVDFVLLFWGGVGCIVVYCFIDAGFEGVRF